MEYASWRHNNSEESKKPRTNPGPINNNDIIDNNDCYKSNNPSDIYNIVLRPTINNIYDYKIISEEQWNYLFELYGGFKQEYEFKIS